MMNYRQKHRQQQKQSRRLFWLGIVVCLLATMAYLRSRLWVIDLSYEYSDLSKTLNELKEENARLRLNVGQMRSPARVEKFAREKLGLKSRDELRKNVTIMVSQTPE